MPKLLVDRFTDDTIRQFRAAARIRNEDAWRLSAAGRGAAAIYLWGYVAEMTLKAAWFELAGFAPDQAVGPRDLRAAVKLAETTYGIHWPVQGRLHAVWHWAQLVTLHRMAAVGGYADPSFATAVVDYSRWVHERWRETLRYKKNRPYSFEVRMVAESAGWLLANFRRL